MVENEHSTLTPGYIYICYQGVGKSSTVNDSCGFIDLESSNFRLEDGYRPDDWYKYYVNIACDLATQGYSVFVSSHDVVREELARLRDKYHPELKIAVVFPSPDLKEEWVERLQARYDANPTKKNEAALGNAKDRLEENVEEMRADAYEFGFGIIELHKTDYKLIDVLPMQDNNVEISAKVNATCFEDVDPDKEEIKVTVRKMPKAQPVLDDRDWPSSVDEINDGYRSW